MVSHWTSRGRGPEPLDLTFTSCSGDAGPSTWPLTPKSPNGKVGSLLTRVERATDAGSPAAALISFANHLSGSGHRVAKKNLSGSIFFAPPTPTGQPPWREQPSSPGSPKSPLSRSRRLGTPTTPGNCYLRQPCCLPKPGSKTHSQLTKRLHDVRRAVGWNPSVRAYAMVDQPEEALEEACEHTEAEEEAIEMPEEHGPSSRSTPLPLESEASIAVELPWSDVELQYVFGKFSDPDEKELHVEDLPSLLRYLGSRPTDEQVTEIVQQQTMYASLDWFEFMEFLKRFREFDLRQLHEQFALADDDGSGTLDISELHGMLVRSGYAPTKEATLEALAFVDDDNNGTVCFSEFEQLREHLRVVRGFLKAEAEEYRTLFHRVAKECKNKLAVSELGRIGTHIGYHISAADLLEIVHEVDKDGSGVINYDEMLQIIRAIRDAEGVQLQRVFAHFYEPTVLTVRKSVRRSVSALKPPPSKTMDVAGRLCTPTPPRHSFCELGGRLISNPQTAVAPIRENRPAMLAPAEGASKKLKVADLITALSKLGYYASKEITQEILQTHLADRAQEDYVSWEEVTMFLRAYRRCEGFTQKELVFLRECFDREQAVSAAGEDYDSLDALELGRVLRGFGISRTLQQVQRLIEEIDFDGSGQLEFGEFTKLMRQLFHDESGQRRKIFNILDTTNNGTIDTSLIQEAMRMINGVEADPKMILDALRNSLGDGFTYGDVDLTLREFEQFCEGYRQGLMHSVGIHAGFIPSEVEILRSVFDQYDDQSVGVLGVPAVRNLVKDFIPEAIMSQQGKLEVMKMLEELVTDETEGLIFSNFLCLMRRVHDQRDERDIVREADVVQACEYTAEEVEGLRHVFSSNIDWTGEIGLEALTELFDGIITVKEREEDELCELLRNISPYHTPSVRFPEFLVFMKQLVQQNALGLNDASDRILRREAAKPNKIEFRAVAVTQRTASRRTGMAGHPSLSNRLADQASNE